MTSRSGRFFSRRREPVEVPIRRPRVGSRPAAAPAPIQPQDTVAAEPAVDTGDASVVGLADVVETPVAVDVHPIDVGRDLEGVAFYSACYAPSVSLFFNQHGDVRACSQNLTGALGNIRLHSIREIWDGEPARRLRAALARRDFSEGCGFCEWQEDHGDSRIRFSRQFDGFAIDEAAPAWPRQMEFALTNACNLQCVMCTGWNSSSIRTHREKLPPLDCPYGDGFFEELAEFLPHLEKVTLLGGEPFLGGETLRVLEMIAELPAKPAVWVTTNGTQWTPRVRRICERVPMTFEVSVDGATAETFEGIRLGASFGKVMANIEHFKAYAREHGTKVGLSYCLMAPNWHEFFDLLRYAEEADLDFVSVNQVTYPMEHSLFRLPVEEFAAVVDALEDIGRVRAGELTRFGPVWDGQLAGLRARLAVLERAGGHDDLPWSEPWDDGDGPLVATCRDRLRAWSGGVEPTVMRGDAALTILDMRGPLVDYIGFQPDELVGRAVPGILDLVGRAAGAPLTPAASEGGVPNEVAFVGVDGGRTVVELRSYMFRQDGDLVVLLGIRTPDASLDPAADAAASAS